jgi:hypothetical protein
MAIVTRTVQASRLDARDCARPFPRRAPAHGMCRAETGDGMSAQNGGDVSTAIGNPRVLVTRQRYGPIAYGPPLPLHPDGVILYLRGGYTWPRPDLWGASRMRRGDVNVVPASTPHRLSKAGSDPLELLTIGPR